MEDNLKLYNAIRSVPDSAKKPIQGGRLKGKTDINPMWRIKTLTEQFGPVGFGWYYEITEKRLEEGGKDEISAFVQINLYVKDKNLDQWSKPIVGIGGASFVSIETKKEYQASEKSKILYVSDECFKMALTDAISVACKALGMGADVYWEADQTKYDVKDPDATNKGDASPRKNQTSAAPPTPPADLDEAVDAALQAADVPSLMEIWKKYRHLQGYPDFVNAKNRRKAELQ